MSGWQRRARGALAIFMVAFGVIVYFAIRERPSTAPPRPAAPPDPKAVAVSTRASVLHFRGSREDTQVESERQVGYQDGSMKLEVVKVTIRERLGRSFTITAREALVGKDRSEVEATGDVVLSASDGLIVRTGRATYADQEGVLRAPGRVEFTKGTLAGSSNGATYDRPRDLLLMHEEARITGAAGDAGGAALEIASRAAEIARRDRYMRFEGSPRMVRGDRVVEAQSALARLQPEADRLERVELHGGARITSTAAGAGGLRGMSADDITLSYAEDGQALTHALLSGGSAIELGTTDGQEGRRLSAAWIELAFAPDGATVTSLAARDTVVLEIPPQGGAPARRIRSVRLESAGGPQGLTEARFIDAVEFSEAAGGGKAARIARARTLDVATRPGLGAFDEARFRGDVTIEDGELKASAQEARYALARGVIDLIPVAGQRARPRVTDRRSAIEADTIAITLEGRRLVADGDVRSELVPGEAGAEGERGKTPGLLRGKQPASVTARHLEYAGAKGTAVYTGAVRLWQADTTIQAETVQIDEQTGNLAARGAVRSNVVVEQVDAKTNARQAVPTLGTAEELDYEEKTRRVIYRRKAHVRGPQGDLTGDRIELFLAAAGSALERVEAYEGVTLRVDARSATGARLTYFAADERYVMHGSPVKIVEECRETTGKILTFFKSTDTIVVDGNEERTHTKAGVNCSGPPAR
jgi:lipopolysaccharide transport protein LptA